jgi:hypothetical protein
MEHKNIMKTLLAIIFICNFTVSSLASEDSITALRYTIARLIATLDTPSVQQVELRSIYIDLDAQLIVYKIETKN